MENSLERLEQIMKPYFDKKEEIEKLSTSKDNEINEIKEEISKLREKRRQERTKLELRLKRLRENKEREIEEYVASQPSFYAGYAATVRKDLEQAYKAKEDELIAEIKSFNSTTQKQIENLENLVKYTRDGKEYFIDMSEAKDLLSGISGYNQRLKELQNSSNYNRVYIREMIEVKESLRKPLIAEQKEITALLQSLIKEQKEYLDLELSKLILELQSEKSNFNRIMLELSNFKYQYNDQHQVINGGEWRKLFEESNKSSDRKRELKQAIKNIEESPKNIELINKINEVKDSLKVVEEYLNLTELTKEEIAVAMSSLTPWEKAEYDRRNGISNEIPVNQPLDEFVKLEEEPIIDLSENEESSNNETPNGEDIPNEEEKDESKENEISEDIDESKENENSKETVEDEEMNDSNDVDENAPENTNLDAPEDLIDSYTPVEAKFYVQNDGEKSNIVVDSMDELSKLIYNDILNEAENMRSIKLDPSSNPDMTDEYYISDKDAKDGRYYYDGTVSVGGEKPIKLPNGEYLNSDDIDKAVKNYYKKNKGQRFIVKDINKTLSISKKQIRKLKKKLKQCSTVRLMNDKKIVDLDVKRVYGKERYDELKNLSKMGTMLIPVPAVDYISRDEFISRLGSIFTSKEKRLEWLKKLSDKVKSLRKNDNEEVNETEISPELEYDDLTEQEESQMRI